jgi:phosphate transport system substrate-binding protein
MRPDEIKTSWLHTTENMMKTLRSKVVSLLAAIIFLAHPVYGERIVTINVIGVPYMHTVCNSMAGDFAYGERSFFHLNYIDGKTDDFAKKVANDEADFSISDIALSRRELDGKKLMQVPAMVTAIVPVVNLPGIESDKLVLNGPVLADIMSGAISTWNHDSIKALNPRLILPSLRIKPIARSDQSGATLALTSYLSKASPDFNTQIGIGSLVKWPSAIQLSHSGDALVSAIHATPGAISYIEMDEGNIKRLSFARIKHHSGSIVKADIDFLKSGVVGAKAVSDANGTESIVAVDLGQNWPILLPIYINLPQKSLNDERMSLALRFIYWIYAKGDDTIEQSGLVPLPVILQTLAVKKFRKMESSTGTPLVVNFDL